MENTQFTQNDVYEKRVDVGNIKEPVLVEHPVVAEFPLKNGKHWMLVVSLLLALGIISGGYYFYSLDKQTEVIPKVQARTTEERVKSVVLLEKEEKKMLRFRGSGLVISKQGHILTNAHVVINEKTGETWPEIEVYRTSDPTKAAQCYAVAKVLSIEKKLDLALLQLASLPDPSCKTSIGFSQGYWYVDPTRNTRVPKIGDEIFAIGYPTYGDLNDRSVTLTSGNVSGFPENYGFIKTDAKLNHGSSGGAAFDKRGFFVGITSGGLSDSDNTLGAIIPASYINQWLSLLQDQGVLKGIDE